MPRNLNNITQTNGYTVQKPSIPLEWSSSYQAKTNQGTGDCGRIIPVFFRELMPNQTVNISQDIAIQFTPFVSNLFHEIKGELITYFVPYRICAFMRDTESIDGETLQEADQLKWEAFIDGGLNGQDSNSLDTISLKKLRQHYTGKKPIATENEGEILTGTLADYFGMPLHLEASTTEEEDPPNILLWNAYNLIYNTKLRNPDITSWKQMKYSTLTYSQDTYNNMNSVAIGYWNADRFTRARKIQLRGIAPAIPVTNDLLELAVKWSVSNNTDAQTGSVGALSNPPIATNVDNETKEKLKIGLASSTGFQGTSSPQIKGKVSVEPGDLSVAIDYNEFLYNLAILRYETNNARIKPRYTEFLKYRFGIIPQDSRFQEPEWVDSSSFNIGVDTVTATGNGSFTTSGESNPRTSTLGEITGQGWGGGQRMNYNFKAQEHGVLMTMMIIKPLGVYEGGLDRHWWGYRNRFDFPTPELMNTPDVKIWKGELKFTGVETYDKQLFGWQSIYDEDRTMTNQVCGLLRPSLDNGLKTYTLARFFSDQPTINNDFLLCRPNMDRIKQYTNQPDFIFFHRAEMKTAMPMPLINEPVNI